MISVELDMRDASILDGTQRKRAEEELRRSRHYLAEAQKLTHTGSWAFSPLSGDLLYWSEECYRILGFDPARGLPSFDASAERIHPEDRPEALAKIDRYVRAGNDFELEYRLLLPDGLVRNVRIFAHPVRDASGTVVEFIGTVMDITEQKRAEEERAEHVWFLESMDRINRAMQRTSDVEGMMSGVLDEALAIFGSDRAWLVYPCDPDSPTVRAVMEHTNPEYPGAFALGEELPVDTHAAEAMRRVLDGPGAVTDLTVSPELRERFSIESTIAIAVRPKGDRPYLFGLHQCSQARAWTGAERRLFEEIARRLEDALTSVLAHRKLLQREAQIRRLVDANIVGIVFWDLDGRIRDANDAFLRMVGYERADLVSGRLRWTELTPAEWREQDERAVAELNLTGTFQPVEKEYFRKDGSRVPVLIGGALFQDGGCEGVAFVLDLSEQERAEKALRSSEAYLAEAQTLSQTGSWAWSPDRDISYWSDECYRVLSFDPRDGLPRFEQFFQRIHPDDQPRFRELVETATREKAEWKADYRIVHPGGAVRDIHVVGHPVLTASDDLVEFVGTVIDVTETKRAEEELRRSRTYLAEAQKVSHTGSWAWNNVTRENVYWSEECFRIHGRDPAQGRPSLEETLADIHPDDVPGIVASLEKALREGREWEGEYRLTNFPDGPRTVRSMAHPVLDPSGQVVEYIGTVMDITKQKRAEEERREHLWFLESMDRVNRAMQRTNDVEAMMRGVLEETLAVFGSDRARLVYPCDPDAATCRIVMEHTRSEYPSRFALGEEIPIDAQMAGIVRLVLEAPGATDPSLPPEIRERFGLQSLILIAVRPKGDRPYLFTLHQCSHERTWTAAERRLFEEIARRLEDALTSVLAHRNLLASEEELRASEERYRTFVDHASEAFILYDDKAIVHDVNRRACEALGYSREELIGMHVSKFAADATPEKIEALSRQLLERGTVTYNSLRRRKDGSVFPTEVRSRTFTRDGRVFAVALGMDITERRRREQCVLAQHRVTQALSEGGPLEQVGSRVLRALCEGGWDFGVAWRLDARAGVLRCADTWSPSSAPRPGFEAATRAATIGPGMELAGQAWSSGAPVCVRDIAADPSSSRAELAAVEGLHAAFAFPVVLKSGVYGVVEFFSREVRDADPELLQMMATVGAQVGQFVERSRAEDALRAARSELAHVTRVMSLGELTASIAHEVNQPLGAMVTSSASASRWLAADPPNLEKARLALARIGADGERASAVIDRIRRLVKRQDPNQEPIDVNDTIRSVVALTRDELERAGVAHALRFADNLPLVRGDRVLLQQVILNLILNAIDAMRETGDRARVLSIESRLDEGGEARVHVRDTGRGLPPDAPVFEAFYTTKEGGLGMGLSISRSIVEAHGGCMHAQPNEPHGAIFEFSLPVAQPS